MSNLVPDGWGEFKLANIFMIQTGGIEPSNYPDEKFKYYSLPQFDTNGSYSYVFGNGIDSNKTLLLKPSILVSKLNPRKSRVMLATNIDDMRSCASTEFISYVPKSEQVQFSYFGYFFKSREFQARLEQVATGSTNSHVRVSPKETLSWKITVPPVQEQQKIAAILTSVDDVIEKTQAQINKLKDLKTGMMQELLTRGVGVDGKPHTEFKDSPVGRIPKEWDCVLLESLLITDKNSMRSGPFGSALLKHELVKKGHPYLGIDNVHVERFENKFKRFVSDEKFEQLKKFAVREDDVMITIMGTVGRSCLVPKGVGKALSSKHVWTMTFDLSKYIPSLICWQLNYSDWVKKQFRNEAQGGVMESISSKTLKGLWLPLPPLSEQVKIAEAHETLSKKIESKENILNKYQLMKKALMQDLLTGKVRVNVD
ncbi:restriction endonuclease subunit S [Photobacterium damselae]